MSIATIHGFIKRLEDLREDLLEGAPDDLTDYAKEQAAICIESAIEKLKENED